MNSKRRQHKRAVRQAIFGQDDFTCQLCGFRPHVPADWDGTQMLGTESRHLTIDHLIERCLGGSSTKSNFQTLCNRCNVAKSVHVGQLVREGQELGLNLEEARSRTREILGLTLSE